MEASVETLMPQKTYCVYKLPSLLVYDHIFCTVQHAGVMLANKKARSITSPADVASRGLLTNDAIGIVLKIALRWLDKYYVPRAVCAL